MSVVLQGFGLPGIDSSSSIVAWGFNRNLGESESIETAVASAGIDELFVIDFSYGKRKMNKSEYRKYQALVDMMRSGQVSFYEKKTKAGRQFAIVKEPIARFSV